MDRKLPELAVAYIKFGTTLLCSWPVDSNASYVEKIIHEIKWWFLFLLGMSVEVPMIYTTYVQRTDFMELTKFICFSSSVGHGIIKMIICKKQHRMFQKLIEEMKEFIKNSDSREREALDSCVRQAGPVHLAFNMSGYFTAVVLISGPLVLPQILPTEAQYPFAIDYYPVLQILYVMQSLAACQCSAVGPLDGQVCMLIWFIIGRLKLLASEMKSVTGFDDLNHCVRIHQKLLRYIDEVYVIARPIVFTTVAMATVSIAFGAIHLVGLKEAMSFNEFRKSAGLPIENISEGTEAMITGWGRRRSDYTGPVLPELQKLKVTVLNITECCLQDQWTPFSSKICTKSVERGGACPNEPFEVKILFIGLDIGYGLELFLSAWAAENLMTAMNEVQWSLYDSSWLNSSKRVNKSVLFIMQRLSNFPKLSISGFIPELSLSYYAVYLSKTMSFFTTLHVMLEKMEETSVAN